MNDIREIEEIKVYLGHIIEEWTGYDLPQEGDEDFDTLQMMYEELEAVESLQDAIDFVAGRGIDAEEWFQSIGIDITAL